MRLYLMRHGKSEFGLEEDETRPLSPRGHDDVVAIANHVRRQELHIQRVIHSPLTRARQTAEIMADYLAPEAPLIEMDGIEPWGDVAAFAKTVEKWTQNTLVCGHEPFLGQAISHLVTGDENTPVVEVKTGSMMALSRVVYGQRWQLRWMLSPRIVRGPKKLQD